MCDARAPHTCPTQRLMPPEVYFIISICVAVLGLLLYLLLAAVPASLAKSVPGRKEAQGLLRKRRKLGKIL